MKNKPIAGQRQDDILDAATRVFSRRGYRLTDVQEIADILKVGKGTIYRHFDSKEKLFTSVIERGMNQFIGELHQNIGSAKTPIDKLRSAIQTHINFFNRNMELVELIMQERSEFKNHFKQLYLKHYRMHQKRIESIIRECIDAGQIKVDDPKSFTSLLIDLYFGVLFTAYLSAGKDMLKQKGEYILNVLIKKITK